METVTRQQVEESIMKLFRNAEPETQERIFENLIFQMPFETIKQLLASESNNG